MPFNMTRRRFWPIVLVAFILISAHAEDRTAIAAKYLRQEKNDVIRANAITSLQGCEEPHCKQLLLAALHDSSWVVRYRAIISLMPPSTDLTGTFLALLKDRDDMVWLGAVNGLIQIGEPALAALRAASSDRNPFVREGAIVALGKIGQPGRNGYYPIGSWRFVRECKQKQVLDKESGPILLRALHDEDINVRRDATEAIACFEAPEAVDSLLKIAKDPETDVRAAAFAALEGYSDSRIIFSAFQALRDSKLQVRQAAADLLAGHLTVSHTDMLIALLRDPDAQIRSLAIDLINRSEGEKLDKRLLDEIRSQPANLIAWAKMSHPDSSSLVKILFDLADLSSDNEVVSQISQSLADAYDPSLLTLYMNALQNSRHAMIRRIAAASLLRLLEGADPIRPEIVTQFIGDSDPEVRSSAAFYGAKIGDARAIPILEQIAKDPDHSIRSRAIKSLAKFMPATFDFLSALLLQDNTRLTAGESEDVCRALESSGKKAETASVLVTASQSQNPDVIAGALDVLYDVDKTAALLQFNRITKGDNQKIRAAAIGSARSSDLESTKILLGILGDEMEAEEMRDRAFDKIEYSSAVEENSEIRGALYAILKRESTAKDLKQRIAAAMMFSAPEIFSNMVRDPDVCGPAVEVAFQRNIHNRTMLLPELGSGQTPRDCRIGIAMNLRDTTDPSSIEKLREVTMDKDPVVRAAVASVLGEISSTVTLPALEKLLHDPDRDVREKAKAAIKTIRSRQQQE